MDVWDTYQERLVLQGADKRSHMKKIAINRYLRKLPDSLSYKHIMLDGKEQEAMIINTEDYYKKIIHSLPGEKLKHGGLVEWEDNKWLITELDADNELYESGVIEQCNYLLKWLNEEGEIVERWCRVVDGTKYLIGEKTEDIMAIGDARIAITLAKDDETSKLHRGKRFLVDDMDAQQPLAYQITKPNKLFNIYNNNGVFRFILNEVNLTDNDNTELRIADYYNWTPVIETDNQHKNPDVDIETIVEEAKAEKPDNTRNGKKVWL